MQIRLKSTDVYNIHFNDYLIFDDVVFVFERRQYKR